MEIKLNEKIGQLGLFTTKKYAQGEIIFILSGKEFDKPTRESIYIGEINGKYIHVHDKYGQYINHSFEPSVIINGYNVIAIKDLDISEEITFDYNQNELQMASPFMVNGKIVNGQRKI
jgi:hypothetical protein